MQTDSKNIRPDEKKPLVEKTKPEKHVDDEKQKPANENQPKK